MAHPSVGGMGQRIPLRRESRIPSDAVRCRHRQIDTVKCPQIPSDAVRCHQIPKTFTFIGKQKLSVLFVMPIRYRQIPPDTVGCRQIPSDAVRYRQKESRYRLSFTIGGIQRTVRYRHSYRRIPSDTV